MKMQIEKKIRGTTQELMPQRLSTGDSKVEGYDIYPVHELAEGKISIGLESLAEWICAERSVRIDGYVGVYWNDIQQRLDQLFRDRGLTVNWVNTGDLMKNDGEIEAMVAPFLGEAGEVWGKNTTLDIADFFQETELSRMLTDTKVDLNVVIGVGASLVKWDCKLVYMDLPKNELLFRMRAGSITNLGSQASFDRTTMYKRFYFVDWVVLNKHKERIIDTISVFADAQWGADISWADSNDIYAGLKEMATSVFRPRPWFDPGAWGGQWMRKNIANLSQDEENYAWSFEIIAPENGLVLGSGGNLLEVSFDVLMYRESKAVMGVHADRFGSYFPIRFDFLDTIDGGNLSVQCHPTLSYIQQEFGEKFTQDETYYMLECKEEALVYLGFRDDIDPEKFRNDLDKSKEKHVELEVTDYLQHFKPQKHDFYLIPNGTVHSSGRNNLVLEISATPYIFTFKMYDWLQKDLAGNLRPINIEHAFRNLDFSRKGQRVTDELISKPCVYAEGADWKVIHLPTHAAHYYDVHRLEFEKAIDIETNDSPQILMLVEGSSITVETNGGESRDFSYAETFIIPAASGCYRIYNKGTGTAKVVKAFLKSKPPAT